VRLRVRLRLRQKKSLFIMNPEGFEEKKMVGENT